MNTDMSCSKLCPAVWSNNVLFNLSAELNNFTKYKINLDTFCCGLMLLAAALEQMTNFT